MIVWLDKQIPVSIFWQNYVHHDKHWESGVLLKSRKMPVACLPRSKYLYPFSSRSASCQSFRCKSLIWHWNKYLSNISNILCMEEWHMMNNKFIMSRFVVHNCSLKSFSIVMIFRFQMITWPPFAQYQLHKFETFSKTSQYIPA